jgi:hypothetical protein
MLLLFLFFTPLLFTTAPIVSAVVFGLILITLVVGVLVALSGAVVAVYLTVPKARIALDEWVDRREPRAVTPAAAARDNRRAAPEPEWSPSFPDAEPF